MSITNATNFRKHLFVYLDAAALRVETVLVTTKNGTAAVVSEEYLRSLEETCFLYGIPGMRESIDQGLATPVSECVRLNWKEDLR